MNIDEFCNMRESRRVFPEIHLPISTISTNQPRHEQENLPRYNHFITSQIGYFPPNSFDISIVPEGAVLHYSVLKLKSNVNMPVFTQWIR